jgi:hypothetical protein
MKKTLSIIACVIISLVFAVPGMAFMDDINYDLTATGMGASSTGSATYTVRGVVHSVIVTIPRSTTGTVSVVATDTGQTILSKTAATHGTNIYQPRVAMHLNTSGAALTDTHYGYTPAVYTNANGISIANDAATNSYTVTLYDRIAVAGSVKASFANTTTTVLTNAISIKLIIEK